MMYGMQYIQQTIVGIDGSEARFFGYVATTARRWNRTVYARPS